MSWLKLRRGSINVALGLSPTSAAALAIGVLLLVLVLVLREYELRIRWKDGEFEMRPTAAKISSTP